MGFLPDGHEVSVVGDSVTVHDVSGRFAPVWTWIMQDMSKGHDRIQFRNDLG